MEEALEVSGENKYIGKWTDERLDQVYKYALLGLSDAEIAGEMGITPATFSKWKVREKGFEQALERGRRKAVSEVVNAMYKAALGYYYEEEVVHCFKGQIFKTTVRKYSPPNVWIGARILSLREPKNWSETHKMEITNTNININKLDFSGITDDELLMLKKIGLNQLVRNAGNS